jgi:hypothetical protein
MINFCCWFSRVERKVDKIMAGVSDIKTAQAGEKADLAALVALLTQLLAAFAAGTLTSTDAAAILAEINDEDSTVKTAISTIQAALAPAPAA